MNVERKRLKDVNLNSRGLLSPRFYDYKIMASERRVYKALRHAELVSASHCEPLLTPFTR